MAKYTKGPWRIAGKATIRAGDTAWIANVHFANREANARLIAASPTLLEAVIAAEDYFATLPADDAAHSLYLQMNAAITLATGKDA